MGTNKLLILFSGVFVSYYCYNKVSCTWWLKTRHIYSYNSGDQKF